MSQPKLLQIFRAGKHTATSGDSLEFSAADLAASATAYDPALHEAPMVVGHPKDNAPAYGWIGKLQFADRSLNAEPIQVDPAFAELVQAGRYKKISASFYAPDSPHNPKPGVYYLRHVGFLGAQPPAVKGLRNASFAESEQGVVEFSDGEANGGAIKRLFRSLREWLIAEKGVEAADKVLPSWDVDSVQTERMAGLPAFAESAQAPLTRGEQSSPALSPQVGRGEHQPESIEMSESQKEHQAQLDQRAKALDEREAKIRTDETAAARKDDLEFVETQVAAGRVAPAAKNRVVEVLHALRSQEPQLEFAEGEKTIKASAHQAFRDHLAGLPKLIEFSEQAGKDKKEPAELDAETLGVKAREFAESERAQGREITMTAAVRHIKEKGAVQ